MLNHRHSAAQVFIPALFGHADGDTFIGLHHSQRLFAAYAGDKNLVTFGGDHNSHRAPFFYSSAVIFLHSALQCPKPLPRGEPLVDPAAHLHTCAPCGGCSVFQASLPLC